MLLLPGLESLDPRHLPGLRRWRPARVHVGRRGTRRRPGQSLRALRRLSLLALLRAHGGVGPEVVEKQAGPRDSLSLTLSLRHVFLCSWGARSLRPFSLGSSLLTSQRLLRSIRFSSFSSPSLDRDQNTWTEKSPKSRRTTPGDSPRPSKHTSPACQRRR